MSYTNLDGDRIDWSIRALRADPDLTRRNDDRYHVTAEDQFARTIRMIRKEDRYYGLCAFRYGTPGPVLVSYRGERAREQTLAAGIEFAVVYGIKLEIVGIFDIYRMEEVRSLIRVLRDRGFSLCTTAEQPPGVSPFISGSTPSRIW